MTQNQTSEPTVSKNSEFQAKACCSTKEQASCCEPSAKAGCCGTQPAATDSGPATCGCR